MIRLRICAFGALVITCTAAHAQDVQTPPTMKKQMTGVTSVLPTTDRIAAADSALRLGVGKPVPVCPTYCAPLRVTSPAQATVGEREVLTAALSAATGSKLHVDSSRSVMMRMDKLPSAAIAAQAPALVTRNEFRPALDPVLAEPITEPLE